MKSHVHCLLLLLLAPTVPDARSAPPAVRLDMHRRPVREAASVQGASDGRFAWSQDGLSAAFDASLPSSRLVIPLGFELTGADAFVLDTVLTLHSATGSPDDFMQVSFGLVSTSETGLNRTGTALPGPPFFVDDADVYHMVELAYFPNVTAFGGPFLVPTVFGGEVGSPFANFAANFGPSADLGDNPPGSISTLPEGVPLRVRMVHDACRQLLLTSVFELGPSGERELETGLLPLDLRFVDATSTFRVDAFAVNAHEDLADFDRSTLSLRADVTVHSAHVTRLDAPRARLLPRTLLAGAEGPAHVEIRGLASPPAAEATVRVHAPDGDFDVPATVTGRGDVLARFPRGLVPTGPFAVEIDGCRLAVAAPRTPGP